MRKLSIVTVVLALVAAAAVAAWASVAEAPWERTTSSHPDPTPTVQSLDDEMAAVARQFLRAWKTPDYDAMKALMDEESLIRLHSGSDFRITQWPDASSDEVCGDKQRHRYVGFPCRAYEVTNVMAADVTCEAPTPAEAANGYGNTCKYWLAYAWRSPSGTKYHDGDFCVEVRVKNSVPKVIYAADDSRCE